MSSALIQSRPSAQRSPEQRPDVWRATAVCGLLVLAVLLVFSGTVRQGFSNYDDNLFICDEPHVSSGLSWSNVVWAFTNGPMGDWYPLSMLSHMLDCQLYGLHPAGHHVTNVLLHAASAVTLFLVLWRMTGELWPSALVAALFAIHPLHVESVAWLSERRDVLSGLFFMLTLGAYGEYARQPRSLGRYLAMVGFFILGLMAKPILVTLPPLLLLLDYWPLGRFGRPQPDAAPASFPWRVVLEKLPLFALAIAAAGVTVLTHGPHADSLTFPERLANAAVSYVAYLGQFFVPLGLSAYYSHPEAGRPAWHVAAAVVLLLTITTAATIGRRSHPYFFVGWFWYVGMLVPVSGLVFVGPQARGDRYTYLSQIGLSIAVVWGAMRLGASWPARRWAFGVGSALMLAALMACSRRQTEYWRSDVTLFEHALACDPKNATAHYFLGVAWKDTDERKAVAHYRQALQIGPNERNVYNFLRAQTHNDLGNIASRNGDYADAIAHYEQALEMDPSFTGAEINIGKVLVKQGKLDEALIHFQRSAELAPGNAVSPRCMAVVQTLQGKIDEAIANYHQALAANPNSSIAHLSLAGLLAERDKVDEAILHVRRVIEIEPNAASSYYQMAQLLRRQGKTSEAAKYDEQGVIAARRFAEAENLRGSELAEEGKTGEAIAHFQLAVAAAPDYAEAHANLADALASRGNVVEALAHYRRALEIDPNLAPAKQGFQELNR